MSSEANIEALQQHDKNDDRRSIHNKRKRGMKPRSERDRKKPKSKHDQPIPVYESNVSQLQLGNKLFNTWVRTIAPYPFTFKSHAKKRWIGRTVLEVYQDEFRAYPNSYYLTAIEQGRILVSDVKVNINYQVKDGDILSHTVHRHEPGVAVNSSEGIDVIMETDDLVVVNKPGTMPVHQCGGYNQNSMLCVLEPKFGKLYNINRLDRLTSGLLMLAKSSKVAQRLGNIILHRDSCEKMYLARVKGKFPMNCNMDIAKFTVEAKIPQNGEWITRTTAKMNKKTEIVSAGERKERNALGFWVTDISGDVLQEFTLEQVFKSSGSIEDWLGSLDSFPCTSSEKLPNLLWFNLACPVRIAEHKDGICEGGSFAELDDEVYQQSVKPAQTAFGVVRYDEATDSTVVICRPRTGRTHQIRLHLRYLGHSIANDPNYGGDIWYGNKDGEIACQEAQMLLNALNNTTSDTSITDVPATEEEMETLGSLHQEEGESLANFVQKTCVWCARTRGGGVDRAMLEFLVRSRGIWLHAIKYTLIDERGMKITYRTPAPEWS